MRAAFRPAITTSARASRPDRRHREKVRPRGRRRRLWPHSSCLCLRDRRPARHLRRQVRHAVTAIDLKLDPATRDVIGANADNTIVRIGAYPKDAEQTRCSRLTTRSPLPSPTAARHGHGDAVAGAEHDDRRERARRYRRRRAAAATRAEANGGAAIALTNPGGIPRRHHQEGRRRGELCTCSQSSRSAINW